MSTEQQQQNNNHSAAVSASERMTRAASAKKRAASAGILPSEPSLKKRPSLADITNFAAAVVIDDGKFRKRIQIGRNDQKPILVEEPPHSDDPQMCTAYADDIYQYLHSMEVEIKRRPRPDYIEKVQADVTPQMRGVLVDWLVEVADEYKLLSDTLYLAVNYLDRFLSTNVLVRQKLQLLGVSCMLIASKFEEISPPNVEDFCYITDHTYTEHQVVKMESDILNALKFEVSNPTTKTFLRRFTRTAQGNSNTPNLQLELLGCYLAELSLLDYACIQFLPSMVAASVIYVTNFTIQPNMHPWNSTLQQQSGYRPIDLKECVSLIHDLQLNRRGSSLVAIRNKYKQHKFKCVATLSSLLEIPMEYFEDAKL